MVTRHYNTFNHINSPFMVLGLQLSELITAFCLIGAWLMVFLILAMLGVFRWLYLPLLGAVLTTFGYVRWMRQINRKGHPAYLATRLACSRQPKALRDTTAVMMTSL